MDFRAELQERLERVPFSAAQVARAAGLSREWVAKARKGKAYKIGWDTAQRIHSAIDALAEQAQPRGQESPPEPQPQHHPGIDALHAILFGDPKQRITEAELDELRRSRPDEQIVMPGEALDLALVQRRSPRV